MRSEEDGRGILGSVSSKDPERSSTPKVAACAGLVVALSAPIAGQTTSRVTLDSSGAQANDTSRFASITPDGRFVVFDSWATNLLAGDTNSHRDVFVRDRRMGTTELVSVGLSGAQGNGDGGFAVVSADGRYVAFASQASNLVPMDTNATSDVFVRDRRSGTTERVSVDGSGGEADAWSGSPSISADGRYVAFASSASNLVAGDTNHADDVFVHDRRTGTTQRVSVDSSGAEANDGVLRPSISADGRYVVFDSIASNLVAGDTNGMFDVFVRDRQTGTTELVSLGTSGVQADASSVFATISADGRFVAFDSYAPNLVIGDTNGDWDAFVRDRQRALTERVSVDSAEHQADGYSTSSSISADGRFVVFASAATNLVGDDTNTVADVFVRDRSNGTTERVNVDSAGGETDLPNGDPSISADGRYVVFTSWGALVSGDTNAAGDVYVRDRIGGPSFTSLCDPGLAGVIPCPCANPPSSAGRGCDNSAGTGGARLSASGGTYLSSDSLVFTTSGEKPTATSVLLQGTASPASGAIYGQGVRCVGGTLKRLFTKSASGGSMLAPNFVAGDPTISARSAAKGNPISPGQSRWYLVFYRDPIVLGGCPAASTFNATQTGEIVWSP